jgi:hypothetical protein
MEPASPSLLDNKTKSANLAAASGPKEGIVGQQRGGPEIQAPEPDGGDAIAKLADEW